MPVRAELERYYDTVPRRAARAEDFGPLTLFVRDGAGFSFYARPTLGHPGPVTADDVRRVLARQRELDVPRSIEWVARPARAWQRPRWRAGLTVHEHPLMVLGQTDRPTRTQALKRWCWPAIIRRWRPRSRCNTSVSGRQAPGPVPPVAPNWRHVPRRSFRCGRSAARSEIAAGRTVLAAVLDGDVAVSAGGHNPVGDTTEIVGVATLPAERRRGHGAAVTAALVDHARANGIRTIFLSAGDADVARIYRRLGFLEVGTAMIADGE